MLRPFYFNHSSNQEKTLSIEEGRGDANLEEESDVGQGSDSARESNKKLSKKDLARAIKEDSYISPAKVVITALTAVSMAIISTKLTTVINGITLAAIIAVGSALVSEAYRIVTALTAHGVVKAVEPIEKKNEIDREREANKTDEQVRRRPRDIVREYFARRKNMQLIALFATTAVLTIGTSFIVAKSMDQPSLVSNNYPTEVKAEQLSKAEKQKIVERAVNEATSSPRLPAQPRETSSEPPDGDNNSKEEKPATEDKTDEARRPANESSSDETDPQEGTEAAPEKPVASTDESDEMRELRDEIKKLKSRLDDVESPGESSDSTKEESDSDTTKPTEDESSETSDPAVSSDDVDELQEQIDDLSQKLDDLAKAKEEPTEPPDSSSPEDEESSISPDTPSSKPSKADPTDSGSPSDGGKE